MNNKRGVASKWTLTYISCPLTSRIHKVGISQSSRELTCKAELLNIKKTMSIILVLNDAFVMFIITMSDSYANGSGEPCSCASRYLLYLLIITIFV